MKKHLIFLLLASCILVSCEKDPGKGEISFSPRLAPTADTLMFDSVSYLEISFNKASVVNYVYYDDPNAVVQTIKFPIVNSVREYFHYETEYITLDAGGYIIKKFDLTDSDGNVIYTILPVEAKNVNEIVSSFEVQTDTRNSISHIIDDKEIE